MITLYPLPLLLLLLYDDIWDTSFRKVEYFEENFKHLLVSCKSAGQGRCITVSHPDYVNNITKMDQLQLKFVWIFENYFEERRTVDYDHTLNEIDYTQT